MIKEKYTISDFLPLIIIFGLILIVSFSALFISGSTLWGMKVFMAGFFLVFGGLKVLKLKSFAEAYQMYDLVAKRSLTYAYLYPFIEIGLGLSFLFFYDPILTNLITILVMGVGAIGVYLKIQKKEKILCACLGTVFKVPMTWVTFFEDVLMVGMAIAMMAMYL